MLGSKNINNNPKKSLAAFLIFVMLAALIGNLVLPKKETKAANATLPMQIVEYIMEIINWAQDYSSQENQEEDLDNISDIQDWFKDDTLDRRSERESWNETRKDLLDDLVNDILDSIKDMGDGKPAFVSDWDEFLNEETEKAFQEFVDEELNQAEMCDTFKQEVQQEISAGNEPPYTAQAQCPSDYDSAALLAGTSQNFWSDWLQMIRPSGNPFGAYMIASDKKLEAEALAYTGRIFQLTANQGYRGTEDTPGIIQSNAAQRASMMDLDYLLNSDDLEEYFGSVVDAFINRIINEGLSKIQTTAYSPQGTPPVYPPTVPQQQNSVNYVRANYDYAVNLIDVLNITLDNLTGQRNEQNQNLSLLNQIRTRLIDCNMDTSAADAEIATLTNEINLTQTKINQANQAINSVNALIPIMAQVIAADKASDQPALTAALQNFTTAHGNTVTAIQNLNGSTQPDLYNLFQDNQEYNTRLVRQTNRYILRRGSPYSSDGTASLYGWYNSLPWWCLINP